MPLDADSVRWQWESLMNIVSDYALFKYVPFIWEWSYYRDLYLYPLLHSDFIFCPFVVSVHTDVSKQKNNEVFFFLLSILLVW